MPFTCPQCSTPSALSIVHRLELPSDSRSDEITLQIVECAQCGFAGIAVYEESRRGSLDSDSFDHTGYRVSARDLAVLRKAISQCSQPGNPRCSCAAHRTYGRRNVAARWSGLEDVSLGQRFRMVR